MSVRITYQGETVTVSSPSKPLDPALLNRWGDAVRCGVITTADGRPLTGTGLRRVRERLLGLAQSMPEPLLGPRYSTRTEQQMLIPGLWPFGTYPVLGGNPKAGKTTLVVDLMAALLLPGYRFLDHFEAVQTLHPDGFFEVRLINAETPPQALANALVRAGIPDQGELRHMAMDHLEDLGGAQSFDLTDPQIYTDWAQRLSYCEDCDGSDESTPDVVIVDGVTAILQAAGKGVEHFGLWYAAFRRLMRELDIPNALVIAHNTLSGSHLMGGVEAQAGGDGLWTYSSTSPDNPFSARQFGVRARMGGVSIPLTAVTFVDGRLRMGPPVSASLVAQEVVDEVLVVARRTAEYVRHHPGVGGQELSDNVDSGGSKDLNLAGRAKAVELDWVHESPCGIGVCTICERPHHRRRHYWPINVATEPTEGTG